MYIRTYVYVCMYYVYVCTYYVYVCTYFFLLIKACPITLGNITCRVNLFVHQEVSFAVSLYIV